MKIAGRSPRDWFEIGWTYLRNVGYLFMIFLTGYIIFTVPDQAKDFVKAFIVGRDVLYHLTFIALLLFWSYISWYSASVILEITPINSVVVKSRAARIFCIIIGCIPFLVIAIAFYSLCAHAYSVYTILLGLVFIPFFILRNRINNRPGKWPSQKEIKDHVLYKDCIEITPSLRDEWRFIARYYNVRYYFFYIGIFFLVVLICLCFPGMLISITRFLHPAAVVLLALAFLTYGFTVIFYFHDTKSRPVAIYVVVWMIICSLWNENTKIPPAKQFTADTDFRLSPQAAFEKWYRAKLPQWHPNNLQLPMPVIFIATQGGGIRGELWTSEVMHALDSIYHHNFYNQVFCIGGASGGTVGAVYYNAYMNDSINHAGNNKNLVFNNYRKFAGDDCISPVTGAFAFGESFQKILPFPVPCLDRSKVMMQSFSKSYKKYLQSDYTDSGFLSMYYGENEDTFNTNIPSLFVNGMLAETGQRIITSNLKIAGSSNFKDDIDFFDITKADISIAAASLNCMRFPMLLSPGKFSKNKMGKKDFDFGHVVDGGYRENTGLQAMYSLMCELKDSFTKYNVKPILLYIRNGGFEYKDREKQNSLKFSVLHDLKTPFNGLLNINGTSVPSLGIMKMIEQQMNNQNPLHMYYDELWLYDPKYDTLRGNAEKEVFPLGLFISDAAYEKLKKRAAMIPVVNKKLLDTLSRYLK